MISKRTMIIQSLESFCGFWIVLMVPEENQLLDGFLVKKSWCGVLIAYRSKRIKACYAKDNKERNLIFKGRFFFEIDILKKMSSIEFLFSLVEKKRPQKWGRPL